MKRKNSGKREKTVKKVLLGVVCFAILLGGCSAGNGGASAGVMEKTAAAAASGAPEGGKTESLALGEGVQVAAEGPILLEQNGDGERVMYADLTHDGQDEQIVLDVKTGEADFKEAGITVLTGSEEAGWTPVYERHIDQSHTYWGWVYLYEEEGEAYLLEYDPVLYEGTSRYSYTIFSLTPDGGQEILRSSCVDFDWTGELASGLETQIRELNQEAFRYMEQSQVIAAVGEEYFSGLQMCEFME